MLILVFNSGFTHDKFSSSRGVLAALGSIIVYSGNSLAFYGGGDHRGVEGWRGGGKLRGGGDGITRKRTSASYFPALLKLIQVRSCTGAICTVHPALVQ